MFAYRDRHGDDILILANLDNGRIHVTINARILGLADKAEGRGEGATIQEAYNAACKALRLNGAAIYG